MSIIEMFRETRKSESRLTCSLGNTESPKFIRSCDRENQRIRSDGTLLRAKKKDVNDGSIRIPVDFTGTDFNHTTEFFVRKCETRQANYLKYYLENQQYYLCAEDENVFLLKMDACDPNDDKFMFKVSRVNASSRYSTIKSLKTGMFLVSDTHGNASMRKIKPLRLGDQEIKDREAWFELIDGDVQMDAMMAIVSENISSTAKTCEACEVESIRATV